jgi:protein-S-isoprenylcysteine O-methyltransferase Ste14
MLLDVRVVTYIIKALWGVGFIYWTVYAVGNKKTVYRQSRWALLPYFAMAAFVFYIVIHLRRLHVRILPHNAITQVAGIVLCAAGVALAIWARRILGKNWSGLPTLKEDHELIRRGPYRFVRHPIYSGIILATAGSVLALSPTLLGTLCILYAVAALRFKSLQEEKILARQFPNEYASYKREVRALIPFVY